MEKEYIIKLAHLDITENILYKDKFYTFDQYVLKDGRFIFYKCIDQDTLETVEIGSINTINNDKTDVIAKIIYHSDYIEIVTGEEINSKYKN